MLDKLPRMIRTYLVLEPELLDELEANNINVDIFSNRLLEKASNEVIFRSELAFYKLQKLNAVKMQIAPTTPKEFSIQVVYPDKFCVYTHHYLNGDLAYIGCGGAGRVLELDNRTQKWYRHLKEGFIPKIIYWTEDRLEAELLEINLIRKYRPPINVVGKGKIDGQTDDPEGQT